jgi:DNA-binding transcriptional LysR family regulator
MVVASPDYIARHGVPLTPRDLLDFNCLVYDRPKGGDWRFKGRDGEQSIKVSGNLRSNVAEGLIDAAIAGLGVAALPSFAIAPHLASGQLVALLTDYQLPESTLYAVFLPDRRLPERIRTFVQFLADRFSSDAYWKLGRMPD